MLKFDIKITSNCVEFNLHNYFYAFDCYEKRNAIMKKKFFHKFDNRNIIA